MATANNSGNPATPAPPLASNPTSNSTNGTAAASDHYHAHHDHRPAPTPVPANKKVKSKKPIDSSETSKLLAARISQLEVDNAAEKEQQEEIGTCTCPASVTRLDLLFSPSSRGTRTCASASSGAVASAIRLALAFALLLLVMCICASRMIPRTWRRCQATDRARLSPRDSG